MIRRSHIFDSLPRLLLIISLFFAFSIPTILHAEEGQDTSAVVSEGHTLSQRINNTFTPLVDGMSEVLFFDPFSWSGVYDNKIYDAQGEIVTDEDGEPVTAPIKLIVLWLIVGGLFFTVFMRFINFRGLRHAIALIRGKYDNPNDQGEVTHFQALTTALSATVGLGNIAGVAMWPPY